MKKILVVGSSNVDITHIGKNFPDEGQTLAVDNSYISLGGKGLNQAVAVKRLSNAEVLFISVIGDDFLGEYVISGLKKENINTKYVRNIEGKNTGNALIFVNKFKNNHISVSPESNLLFGKKELDSFKKISGDVSTILLQQEIPFEVNVQILKIAKKFNILTIYDPGPPAKNKNLNYLKYVDFFTPNKHEAEFLLGNNIDGKELESAKKLKEFGAKNVIITLGKKGLVYSGEFDKFFKSNVVETIDPVGSGDCFNGALSVMLNKGENILDSINFAQKAAAFSTTRKGASQSFPLFNQIN